MIENIFNALPIFIFAKNKKFKFIYCNENFAQAAGMDSPKQIIGKTDFDLCWRKDADNYRAGDIHVLKGGTLVNAVENQTQPTKIATLLVNKNLLLDNNGNARGIVGSYVDITGHTVQKNRGHFGEGGRKFYLGEELGNEYFTKSEMMVFKYILLGWNTDKIANVLFRSKKTIESHIAKIKLKLDCSTKAEITPRAVELGLTYMLLEQSN